jgi:hypothetical protein
MTCSYCGKIIGILALNNAFEQSKEIRFNELKRLARTYIDSKIAAPTLIRHLKPLIKKGAVKRTKRGPQNITYSLPFDSPLITKKYAERAETILNSYTQFRSWKLEALIEKILKLSKFTELELLKLELEKQLSGKSIEEIKFKSLIIRNFYTQTRVLLLDSIRERTPLEYKKTIELLKEKINISEKELFS